MSNLLTASKIVKSYSKRRVVDEVTLQVAAGEVVGLLGPNGAGKTTTFYMCVGLVRADSGSITLNDLNITDYPMYKRARHGIAYLPQEPSIFRKLTVEENIMAVLETVKFPNRKARKEKLEGLLAELSITKLRKNIASSLSGGERRRAEIARSLARDPMFILLDEPFAGIDPIAIKDIQEIVQHLKSRNIGVLITDHNVRETLGICDRSYILVDGQILEEGSPEDIANSDKARRYYLGADFSL